MTTPKYLPRSWWADSDWPRGGAALVATDLWREGNVSHYPGRASAFGTISLSSLRSNLRGWWDFHVNTRGWSDIGYQMAIALTTDGPVVVDLRGIGRVPAAHASASNPRANWHGGATLWVIGNTEQPDPELIDAYRHFRHTVWLPRWPTATKTTGHRLVPGTSTGCPGDRIVALIRSGTLAAEPSTAPPPEDDMEIDDRVTLTPGTQSNLGGHETVSVGGLLGYAGAGGFQYINDRVGLLTAQAKALTELASIKAAVNADPVDVAALAAELAPLVIPPVVAAVGAAGGLTPEQVEEAAEKALRDVLREGVEV